MNEKKTHFDLLSKVNVKNFTETKTINGKDLKYLSWSDAWSELKKIFPDATYKVERFNGLPYVFDEATGYMVFTEMTIENITHTMWLPVLDGANKAMKNFEYEYKTKTYTKKCEQASMVDINKTIMRCLVKNIAMFGLGINIYQGEDFPDVENDKKEAKKTDPKPEPAINKYYQAILDNKFQLLKNGETIVFNIGDTAENYKAKITVEKYKDIDHKQYSYKIDSLGE